jgi:hypothetical protein
MIELAMKVMERYGFPTLVAGFLLWNMNEQRKEAVEERAQHTVVLIDQLADLRAKVAVLEGKCK